MSLDEFSQESAEEFRKELQKVKSELSVLGSKINGFQMQFEAFAQQFEEVGEKLKQSAEMWAGGESADIVKAIETGFADLIQYKKDFEAKMDKRMGRKEPAKQPAGEPVSEPSEPSTAEPMALDLDISGIDWMQKGMAKVGLDASWAWAFAYTQEGDVKPETRQLVEAIEQYGKVKVGKHVIGLGGDDNRLLQRKIPKKKG